MILIVLSILVQFGFRPEGQFFGILFYVSLILLAILMAFKVVTNLCAGESGLAGLDAGIGLFDVAALVEGSVSILLATEALDHLVSDLGELATVHVVLTVEGVGRALMRGVESELEVDGVLYLSHWSGLPSFILTTV